MDLDAGSVVGETEESGDRSGSCTEGLGSESSDQIEGEEVEEMDETMMVMMMMMSSASRSMERTKRNESIKRFPPPLSSFSRSGNPVFVLKPVREDGRLKLSKVWIGRPEILRAVCRENRLRLFLVSSEQEDEHEEQEEEAVVANEEVATRWQFPLCSNREGFQRCHRNHHHQIAMWNHQCLATS